MPRRGFKHGFPDRPDLAALERFLGDPGAGVLARAWVEAHHGPAAARAALRVALEAGR